jgi:hypothetical protein
MNNDVIEIREQYAEILAVGYDYAAEGLRNCADTWGKTKNYARAAEILIRAGVFEEVARELRRPKEIRVSQEMYNELS